MSDGGNKMARLIELVRERYELQAPTDETPEQKAIADRLLPTGANYRFGRTSEARRKEIDAEIEGLLALLPEAERQGAMSIAVREADLGRPLRDRPN